MAKMPLALQLYTVRDDLREDFKGTLRAIARMGYQGVELGSDLGGLQPEDLAAFLASLGLAAAGLHVPTGDIIDTQSPAYAYAKALSCPYLSVSRCDDVENDWYAVIEELREAGGAAKSAGLTFTYHNHAQEFVRIDGSYALDMLFERTDPDVVQCELDTYWIKKGGEDPVGYILKFPGRVPQVHIKDMDPSDGSFTEVGNGVMDLGAIYEAAEEVGTQWMIVEQDYCKRRPMESARISIENLKAAGLA